jgi:undecaprenyl phosphate N,N'-diacetylbacillosamine 1-phosphate transferase
MKKGKRLYDVLFSLIIVILFSPLFFIISFFIILSDKGPIIFCSKRVGYKGKVFTIYKFRTLSIKLWEKDKSFVTRKDDYRILFFGRILRSTHMDELPQFINVIKGDMSIIGPRPMPEGLRMKNLSVLPGITGLSQVRMKNDVNIKVIGQEHFHYDDFYERKLCFVLDAYISFKTVCVILRAKGI